MDFAEINYELDPNEVEYNLYEGSLNVWWSPSIQERKLALEKAKNMYPDEYYHRGMHTTKDFNGITIFLKDRDPTEQEAKLTELDGVPFRVVRWGELKGFTRFG